VSTPTSRRRAALIFIFVTVLVDVLAFGLVIPVLPHLVEDLAGGDVVEAAHWVGVFSTTFAIIQLVSSPIQGALSDRFGRRPVILASCFGLGADFVLMALAPSLTWLFVGRVLSAITSASFTTANAYIADITPPEERAQSFGMIGAAFGVGFVIGPALGGWLGGVDLRLPFWVAAVLAFVNFVYGVFVLPESLAPDRRSKSVTWKTLNPFGALVFFSRNRALLGLAAVVFLYNLAHYVYPTVFVLYAAERFVWGPQEVGWTLGVVGAFAVFTQVFLVKRVVGGLGERNAVLFGSVAGAIGFAVYGLAATWPVFLAGIPIMSLWGVSSPATQSMITRQVAADEQGRAQGALSSLQSLTGILGPGLYTTVFAYFIGEDAPLYAPGAPFLVASALVVCALIAAVFAAPRNPTRTLSPSS
jgi:DHA1 family tetracycline resistance protein-like MFS transporter